MGRLDLRFENYEADAAGEPTDFDSSEVSYEGAYIATSQDYIHRELKGGYLLHGDSTRAALGSDRGNTQVADVLRAAMTQQSYWKVLIVRGYYDLATPFDEIEYTVSHMGLEPSIRKNISFAYYELGHTVYIDQKADDKLQKDVDAFITSAYRH